MPANRATITGDPFIQFFIDDLLRSLRTQYIIDIIKPYTRIELDYLAKVSWRRGLVFDADAVKMLNITRNEVEALVVSLILDQKIKGKIDQVNGLLVLDRL